MSDDHRRENHQEQAHRDGTGITGNTSGRCCLKQLWTKADLEERRKLLLTVLDVVYVNARQTKSIVAVRPKPLFRPVFQVAASCEGSGIRIINEPLEGLSLFLVETGESRTPRPEEATQSMLQA